MEAITTATAAPVAATLGDDPLDPVAARAAFFFDLELAELRATIPQADAAEGVTVY